MDWLILGKLSRIPQFRSSNARIKHAHCPFKIIQRPGGKCLVSGYRKMLSPHRGWQIVGHDVLKTAWKRSKVGAIGHFGPGTRSTENGSQKPPKKYTIPQKEIQHSNIQSWCFASVTKKSQGIHWNYGFMGSSLSNPRYQTSQVLTHRGCPSGWDPGSRAPSTWWVSHECTSKRSPEVGPFCPPNM